jgi:hypothetical protein
MTFNQAKTCQMLDKHGSYMERYTSKEDRFTLYIEPENMPCPGTILYRNTINDRLYQVLPDGSLSAWEEPTVYTEQVE